MCYYQVVPSKGSTFDPPRKQVGQKKGSLKRCRFCGRTGEETAFNGGAYDAQLGRPSKWCIECLCIRTRAKRYGVSPEELKEMYDRVGGLCEAGCGKTAEVIDHDHETGALRGVLCHDCNLGLGQIGDTLEAARRVVAYLEESCGSG